MYKKLEAVLQDKGITKHQLALMARMSPSDLYNVFAGKVYLYQGWRERIAEALGMAVEDLFEKEEN